MAALTITEFNPIFDNAQVPPRMLSAPVAADLTKGTPVKFNATTGKLEAMSTADANHLFAGLLTKDVKSGYMGVAFRGLAYMDGISGLNIGQVATLNATAGQLDDTQATADAVLRVVPLFESGGTFKKMVEIFELPIALA